jgi:hypothetical protein
MRRQLGLTGAGVFSHEFSAGHVLVVKQFLAFVLFLSVFLRLDFFVVLKGSLGVYRQ